MKSIASHIAKAFVDTLEEVSLSQIDALIDGLADYLAENRILKHRVKILRLIERILEERSRERSVIVWAAHPFPPKLEEYIARAIEQHIEKKPRIEYRQDPSLLGGLKIRIGDKVFDTTIKRRLSALAR